MLTQVEFRSDAFPPYENEEQEVNPGRYGKRLAEFLSRGLIEHGFEPLAPIGEDWGWLVRVKNDRFPLWIGCGNYDEYPDGFLAFIEPHRPIIRRFLRRINTRESVEALQKAVDKILSNHPNIRDKRWWTYEEFMHSGK
jgi:hypothetical protein